MAITCKVNAGTSPSAQESAHILVVEDEPLAAATLSAYLTRKGYRVSVAHSGSEALKMHRANPANLVITDWLMPQGNGQALVAQLGAETPHVPVIIASGWSDLPPFHVRRGHVIFRKPLDLRQVLASIERLLGTPA